MPGLPDVAGGFALVAVPGLVAVYIGRQLRPAPDSEPTADGTLLEALGISVVVLVGAFLVASVLSWANGSLRIWGGLELSELVSGDSWDYVRERPGQVAMIAAVEFSAYILALVAVGWWGFYEGLTRTHARRRLLTRDDPYVDAVAHTTTELRAQRVHAKVRLTNGDEYIGLLQSISVRPNTDGHRDLFVGSAARIENNELLSLAPDPTRSGLLLNTKDVLAVELSYE